MITQAMKLDAYTMKPLWKMALGFLIVPMILGVVTDPLISIMVTMTFVAFLLNIVFSIGENSNFDKLYGILPIQQRQIVIGRYLFSALVLTLFAIASYLIYVVLAMSQGSVNYAAGFAFLCVSMMIACFFISIQFPIYFKMEYSKAAFMSVVPYIVCFAIGSPLISQLMKDPVIFTRVMEIVEFFQQRLFLLALCGIGGSIGMLLLSYQIAKHVVQKKRMA